MIIDKLKSLFGTAAVEPGGNRGSGKPKPAGKGKRSAK